MQDFDGGGSSDPHELESDSAHRLVTVVVPPVSWTPAMRRAAATLPDRDRPKEGAAFLSRQALDLARVDYIDQEMKDAGRPLDSIGNSPLLLDFSRASAIGYGVLPMLGALLKHRTEAGLVTRIRLPVDLPDSRCVNPVIDYLQTWQFGRFVEAITGHSLRDILTRKSREAWDRWGPEKSKYADVQARGEERLQALSRKYVCLTPMSEDAIREISKIDDANERRFRAGQAVNRHVAEWTTGVLGSLLKDRIVDRKGTQASGLVGSTVLNELLINALVHPKASFVYTYAQFCPPVPSYSNNWYFVLSVWDDSQEPHGLSHKLFTAAKSEKAESAAFGRMTEVFHVWSERGRPRTVAVSPGMTVSAIIEKLKDAPFGSTIAGVTSDPIAASASPNQSLDEDQLPAEFQGFSGLGLYRVRMAAVRALGGFMEYTGSTLRTDIRAARRLDLGDAASAVPEDLANEIVDGHYRVDQRGSKRDCWPVAGNLWTVWLPARPDPGEGHFAQS